MKCSICNKLLKEEGKVNITSEDASAIVCEPSTPKRVKLQRGGCLMGVTYNAIHDQGQGAHLNSPLCGHVFHRVCILAWLKTGSKDCPFCKEYIVSGTLKAIYLPAEDKEKCTRCGELESQVKALTEKNVKLQTEIDLEKEEREKDQQDFQFFRFETKKITEEFTAQVKKLTEDNAELQKKMDEVLQTNAEDLKTSKIQLEGVHREKAKLEEDILQLKKQLEEAVADKMNAEMELHHKHLNFQTERQILKDQLENIKRDREGLEDELERELEIKKKIMEGFTAQIKKLTEDNEDLQKKLDMASKPTFDMDELIHMYGEEIKNLKVTVERVQEEKAKLQEDNQQLKKKMDEVLQTNADEIKSSKIQLERVHKEKAKLEEDNIQLKKKFEVAVADKMKAKVVLYHKHLTFQKERQILNEQKSIKKDHDDLKDKLKKELEIKKIVVNGLNRMTKDNEKLQKKLESAEKQTSDLECVLKTYGEEMKKLNAVVERIQDEKSKLEEDNQQLKKNMEEAQSTVKEVELELHLRQLSFQEERQILEDGIRKVKRDRDVLKNEMEAALSKQQLFEKHASDVGNRVEPMIKENTELKKEILKERSKVEGLTVKLMELEERHNLLMTEYHTRMKEEQDQMALRKAKIASLEECLAAVRRASSSSGVKWL